MKRTVLGLTIVAGLGLGAAGMADAATPARSHVSPAVVRVAASPAAHASVMKAQVPAAKARATKAQTSAAITAAVRRSPLLGDVSGSNITVSAIRLAASNSSWASALVHPKNGQTDDAQVVLHDTASGWTVRDLGTAQAGCGILSAKVRTELALRGGC